MKELQDEDKVQRHCVGKGIPKEEKEVKCDSHAMKLESKVWKYKIRKEGQVEVKSCWTWKAAREQWRTIEKLQAG